VDTVCSCLDFVYSRGKSDAMFIDPNTQINRCWHCQQRVWSVVVTSPVQLNTAHCPGWQAKTHRLRYAQLWLSQETENCVHWAWNVAPNSQDRDRNAIDDAVSSAQCSSTAARLYNIPSYNSVEELKQAMVTEWWKLTHRLTDRSAYRLSLSSFRGR